jgi:hypothetical protein
MGSENQFSEGLQSGCAGYTMTISEITGRQVVVGEELEP